MQHSITFPSSQRQTAHLFFVLKKMAQVALGSLAIAIAAHIQIPLYPVPVTPQDMTVLMIGMLMGWRLGGLTVALYLLEGALGLPVFAAGPAALIGPDAGYLWGFLPAVLLSGYLGNLPTLSTWLKIPLAAVAGFAILFLSGIAVLSGFVGGSNAITLGLMPFLLGDALKFIFLCTVMLSWRQSSQ